MSVPARRLIAQSALRKATADALRLPLEAMMNGTKTRAPDAEMPMLEADAAEVRIDWLLVVGFVASLPEVLMPSSLSHGVARIQLPGAPQAAVSAYSGAYEVVCC